MVELFPYSALFSLAIARLSPQKMPRIRKNSP